MPKIGIHNHPPGQLEKLVTRLVWNNRIFFILF